MAKSNPDLAGGRGKPVRRGASSPRSIPAQGRLAISFRRDTVKPPEGGLPIMRFIAATAAVLIAAGLSGHAAAQDRPAAYANAEACLDANVDAAVAASSGAADAAEFLLGYLCAETVSYARAYQRNSAALEGAKAMMSGVFEEAEAAAVQAEDPTDPDAVQAWEEYEEDFGEFDRMFDEINIDPVTGAVVVSSTPNNAMGKAVASLITNQMAQLGPEAGDDVPVFLRQRAGQLVLARRSR